MQGGHQPRCDLAADCAEQPEVAAPEQAQLSPYSATPETTSPPLSDCGSKLPDYLIDLYKQLKNDLPAFNGDDSWTLPIPGRFVIGQDGMIRHADVNPDYTRRPEPDELLPALLGSAVAAA